MRILNPPQEDEVDPEQGPQRRFVDAAANSRIAFAVDAVHIPHGTGTRVE